VSARRRAVYIGTRAAVAVAPGTLTGTPPLIVASQTDFNGPPFVLAARSGSDSVPKRLAAVPRRLPMPVFRDVCPATIRIISSHEGRMSDLSSGRLTERQLCERHRVK
jgi:hypothetical protein